MTSIDITSTLGVRGRKLQLSFDTQLPMEGC